jgi:23S rRNA (guanosine2251-2'-O)-methyltransferase
VEETLCSKPGSARELWVEHEANSPAISRIIKEARGAGIRVQFMARREMERVAGGSRHQGVALKVSGGPTQALGSFIEALSAEKKKGAVLVALDEIQDPHNLGAIARSAINLGASGLIVPERRSSPVSQAAIQASAGAIQRIPVFRVVNLVQALERCRKSGFWIYGAHTSGKSAWGISLNTPLVLVIGSEGYGMRTLVRQSCDELLKIPQSSGGVSSLNASCAASVLLYEIARQRGMLRSSQPKEDPEEAGPSSLEMNLKPEDIPPGC